MDNDDGTNEARGTCFLRCFGKQHDSPAGPARTAGPSVAWQAIMFRMITGLMNSMGYMGIVFLMFLENVFPPIPSEVIMPLAGLLTRDGRMSFAGVVTAGTLGSVAGALPLYYAGRRVGEKRLTAWADKHGKWFTVSSDDVARAKRWFDRHGGITVFLGRLIPGIRSLISLPAGFDRMNFGKFLIYTTAGSAIWAALLAYAGYVLGQNYDKVEKYLGPASYIVFGAVFVMYAIRFLRQHRRGTGGNA